MVIVEGPMCCNMLPSGRLTSRHGTVEWCPKSWQCHHSSGCIINQYNRPFTLETAPPFLCCSPLFC